VLSADLGSHEKASESSSSSISSLAMLSVTSGGLLRGDPFDSWTRQSCPSIVECGNLVFRGKTGRSGLGTADKGTDGPCKNGDIGELCE
jgi:hypothetical protein